MALTPEWFAHHRERMSLWHHSRLDEALADIAVMQTEIEQLQQQLAAQPAAVTITATSEGLVMPQFPQNATIDLTADVKNAEQVDIPDVVAWTTTGGTLTPNPTDSRTATLVNTPLGDTTVTATTSNGLAATYTVTTVDSVPASITVSGASA